MYSRVLFELQLCRRRSSEGDHRPSAGMSPSMYCHLLSNYQQENEDIENGCQYRTDFNRLMQDNIPVILVGSKLLRIVT